MMRILAAIARFWGAVGLLIAFLVPFAFAAATFEVEPNDTATQANFFTVPNGVTGQSSSDTDQDWYKVTATGAGTIQATLVRAVLASSGTWTLTIKDSANNVLASTTCPGLTCAPLSTGIGTAGTYYFVVSSGTFTDGYVLTATGPLTTPAPGPSCTLDASPSTITAGGTSTLTATCSGAVSYLWTNTNFGTTVSSGTVSPAATTTYSVTGFSGPDATGTSGNTASATVTVTPTAPNCTLTASPSTLTSAGSSILTASCNPLATSYVWTNTGFGPTQTTGSVSLASTTTYTVQGFNGAGAGNVATVTVTVAPPPLPPTCSLTASPSTIIGGGSSTLTATCIPAATSYTWTNTGFAASASSGIVSPTAKTTYSVIGNNAAGPSTSASVTVAVTPGCTLTASPSTVTPGSSSILTATCIPAATTYTWTNTGFGPTVNIGIVSPAASTTYSVIGSNADGAGNSASTTVAVTPCTYSISPTGRFVPLTGANDALIVTSPPACAWTAVSNVSWITMPFNTSGSGNGTLFYSVASNTNGGPRTGTLFVAGQTFTVTQDGMGVPNCTLAASASTINLNASVILTATCSPAATSYAWTPATGLVPGPGNTAAVTPTEVGVHQYSVTGSNAGGAGNTASALVTVEPATFISQSDCFFNWAERTYPGFFAPAGAISNTLAPYYYRYYLQTNTYLATSSADSHVYYVGPLSNNSILDVGALSDWLSTAGCQ